MLLQVYTDICILLLTLNHTWSENRLSFLPFVLNVVGVFLFFFFLLIWGQTFKKYSLLPKGKSVVISKSQIDQNQIKTKDQSQIYF